MAPTVPMSAAQVADRDSGLRALADGDFGALAERLSGAGVRVGLPGPGMLQLDAVSPGHAGETMRLLVSIGVHGNETAPIELMARVLDAIVGSPQRLAVDLLVVVGNPAAIAAGARFIDADLNRMFCADRGSLEEAAEAARADTIMQASQAFFSEPVPKWHLDLHSAIRPSRYARFAVIPAGADDPAQAPLTTWLGDAAIEAAVFNSQHAPTYSAYTARTCGALSCTVELGQVGVLGQQSSDPLPRTRDAIVRLLHGEPLAAGIVAPARFRVAQEIIKRSDDFRMTIDGATHNFTAMAPDALIAVDDRAELRVGAETEYIVFPNPHVRVGQRAGLMVVRDEPPLPDPAAAPR